MKKIKIGERFKFDLVAMIVSFSIIALLSACLIALNINHRNRERFIIATCTKLSDAVIAKASISPKEEEETYKKWYMRILMTHSHKQVRRRMTDWQMLAFVKKAWRFTKLFNFPKNYIMSIGVMESNFNPYESGDIGEGGLFQHHDTTINQILFSMWLLERHNPKKAMEVCFPLKSLKDLRNPIKSLKACVALAYAARYDLGYEIYWISDVHWGANRVKKWFFWSKKVPDELLFYSEDNLKKIDKRHPLLYFYRQKAIRDKFDMFNLNIYKELKDWRAYRKKCTKGEKEWIRMRKFNALTSAKLDDFKKQNIALKKEWVKLKAYVLKAEKTYNRIYGTKKKVGFDKVLEETRKVFKDTCKKIKEVFVED